MEVADLQEQNIAEAEGGPPRRTGFDLRLRTLKSTRQTFARVLREYARGNMDEGTYRALVWGLSQFISGYKTEIDYVVIEEIRARLGSLEDKKG